ncbi:MAG TPA: thioredoxin domain-containing protein [Chitinophagaceae bacterium]|nr:thioredoxin domain-containing protein [Chitinophagaceae bacterium]
MAGSNHLINETSPYLLQHANNPVDWYPWGDEALNKAKNENKPILVSIGYAACHWCHVMERESFENDATAAIMNEHFVNIKIDREERPDLDHIYMDAVQAMTGSGGWPLNVFLTPDAKPFFGGTYFPPQRAFNRPSWKEVLYGVVQAFNEKRHEINAQAENLTEHLQQSNSFGIQTTRDDRVFAEDKIHESFKNVMKIADRQWGGFGRAPKFPQTFTIDFLLRYHYFFNINEALDQAFLSLDKMIDGGIYDQVGGGFARYSTDSEWLVPHFEKMLYDNALLLSVISDAYRLTGNERYKEVIEETMSFIVRELMHSDNGFYAALDADSEGIEGKFYVWSKADVERLLGKEATTFCRFFDITENGNWEHSNILWRKKTIEQFSSENNLPKNELNKIIQRGKKRLLEERNKRVRPLLDDKIILGWNALMNSACTQAYRATGQQSYKQLAIDNMNFLLANFAGNNKGEFYHTWKNGQAKYPAFLDDYSFLIDALLNLQEITGETFWLQEAKEITKYTIENFSDQDSVFFLYTKIDQADVILRKKEVYDGAIPSGNSVMANNLLRLSVLLDDNLWSKRAQKMVAGLEKAITSHPSSFANWLCVYTNLNFGLSEIVITGFDINQLKKDVIRKYIPNLVLMSVTNEHSTYPLLQGKKVSDRGSIFLCRNYTCQAAVFSADDLITLINREKKK